METFYHPLRVKMFCPLSDVLLGVFGFTIFIALHALSSLFKHKEKTVLKKRRKKEKESSV